MKLINIGFGNMVSANRLVAIVSPESAPIKRIIADARERGSLIDATYGRRTRAVIITDSDHVILSAVQPETVANRLDDDDEEELEEDEYYMADIIGMDVYTEDGEKFGVLEDIMETGANDVYVVSTEAHTEVLLPEIHDCILDVDTENRKMTVHLMDGLI